MKFIPYGRQDITEEDIQAVVQVLKSDFITQGPIVEQFEQKLCEISSAGFAYAMNSATSALHVACLSLGVGPGDRVWTSPISFVASSNCALYCGAQVDFVDIDPKTHNMSVEQLEIKLQLAEKRGELPKVVIPVHLCGLSCHMEAIQTLAQQYGFKIIEDASHAIGGFYKGRPIGSCQFSDITVFSFHPVKIVTTGEGGACLTNDPLLGKKISQLRSHGITKNSDEMTIEPHGPWYHQQLGLGFNYRITDIQTSLGLSQIDRLANYIQRRNEIAAIYSEKMAHLPLQLPTEIEDHVSARHLYVIRVLNGNRNKLFADLRAAGIGVNVHYIPIYTQPYYQTMTFNNGPFPNAEKYYAEALTLPMFPTLKDDEIQYVCDQVGIFIKSYIAAPKI